MRQSNATPIKLWLSTPAPVLFSRIMWPDEDFALAGKSVLISLHGDCFVPNFDLLLRLPGAPGLLLYALELATTFYRTILQ
jgi:hypothetical protein